MSITSNANSTFLNVDNAHLRVSGDIHATAVKVGAIEIVPGYSLESTTGIGNTTPHTIEFTNTETSLVTSGDINMLHSSNNAAIKLNSNVVTEFPRSKKLIKYPRVALTSASQDGYVVTASSTLSTGTPANVPYTVFDESLTSFWHTQYPYYNVSNGSYAPGQTALGTGTPAYGTTLPTNELVSGHQGEWISIELPNKIKLDRLKVVGSTRLAGGVTQFPKDVVVAVSDTGLSGSWSVLQTAILTSQNVSNHSVTINITTDASYYKYFALIVKSINSTTTYSATEIGQLELYGIPEYDPDADGVDVKVTSYPNVPNTDWLEVYYDAKDLATMPNTVTDLSPNTNTGAVSGHSPTLDTTGGVNSFVFDGTDDYITSTLTGLSSTQYTMAGWIKVNTLDSTVNTFFSLGDWASGNGRAIGIAINSANVIGANVKGVADATFSEVTTGEWYHVVADFTSGNDTHLYVNGKLVDTVAGTTFAIPTNPPLFIGSRANASGTVETARLFPGSIANFRLFNRALTSDEVWQLYAYQKEYFGHGDLSMTLKAGRLGIGTPEPRAALDVRGDTRLYGINHCSAYKSSGGYVSKGNSYSWTALAFDTFLTEYGGFGFVNNGIRIPVSGVYHCYTHAVFTKGVTSTFREWRVRLEFWVNDTNESNGVDYSNMGKVFDNMQLTSGMEGNRGFSQVVLTRTLVLNAGDILYSKVLGHTDTNTQIDERCNNLQVFMIQAI